MGGPRPPGPGLLCGGSPCGGRQAHSHKISRERFSDHRLPLPSARAHFYPRGWVSRGPVGPENFPESFPEEPVPPERSWGPIFGRDPISIVTPVPKNFPGEISEKSNPLGIVKLVKGRVL